MSDTEQLFIFAGLWTAGALVLAYFIPNWPAKIVVTTLLIGVPFWELPYGYYNFAKLCSRETSVKVLSQFSPQNSICVDVLYSDVYRLLVASGVTRIEFSKGTNLSRNDLSAGIAAPVAHGEEKSAYCFATESNIRLPWRIWRHDRFVFLAGSGARALQQSGFYWAGMWWQEAMSPILGGGGNCGAPLAQLFRMLQTGANP